jgi:YL1 nuclear protein C-terminal domain
MSAIQERERRVTAGKRINFLAGQELEQDEAFWGHDTWQEDSDSFHSSDVASQEDVDEFDSDFDLSENDNETTELEEQIGAAAERDIALEEREQKKRSGAYVDKAKKKGLPAARGKKGAGGGRPSTGGKRVVGEGLNAGIVLNVPFKYQKGYDPSLAIIGTSAATPIPQHAVASSVVPRGDMPTAVVTDTVTSDPTAAIPQPALVQLPQSNKKAKISKPTLAATRVRRKNGKAFIASVGVPAGLSRKSSTKDEQVSSNLLKRGKQAFTQEQMIIEAVQATEPENERWILGRRRSQAEKDDLEQFLVRSSNMDKHGKIVEKFVSRHGYLNTITFPDMDHLPDIIQYISKQSRPMSAVIEPVCAITGKIANYWDPKSGLGYFDIAAFRELRRRFDANELNLDPVETEVRNGSKATTADEAKISDVESKSVKAASIRKSTVSGTKRKAQERKPRPAKRTVDEAISHDQNGCELPSSTSIGKTANHERTDATRETPFDARVSSSIDVLSPPLSPGRKSPRNRKPTSKVLENVLLQRMPSFTSLPSQLESSMNSVISVPKSAEIKLDGGEIG